MAFIKPKEYLPFVTKEEKAKSKQAELIELKQKIPLDKHQFLTAIKLTMPNFWNYWKLEDIETILKETKKVIGIFGHKEFDEGSWSSYNKGKRKLSQLAFLTLLEDRGSVEDQFFNPGLLGEQVLRDRAEDTRIIDRGNLLNILNKDEDLEIFRGTAPPTVKPTNPIEGDLWFNQAQGELFVFSGDMWHATS